jgi:MOSC domain-containing protein YiiM
MVKRFLASGTSGFYFAVLREGEVAAGDPIELVARGDREVTIADVVDRLRERSRGAGA